MKIATYGSLCKHYHQGYSHEKIRLTNLQGE